LYQRHGFEVIGEIVVGNSPPMFPMGPRGEMPPVKLIWYDGGLRPPRPEDEIESVLVGPLQLLGS